MHNEEGRKGARHLRDELMVLTMDTGLPLWGPGAGCIKSGYIRGSLHGLCSWTCMFAFNKHKQ
jgi:hypothetical protein